MEAMEARVARLEKDVEKCTEQVQGLREAFLVNAAEQKGTNDRLDTHAEDMRTSTGMLTKGQVEQEKRQTSSDEKLDRLLGFFDRRDDHADHEPPLRLDHQSAAPTHGFAAQLNSLDSRWVALVALGFLVAGGTVSAGLAESVWQWFAAS